MKRLARWAVAGVVLLVGGGLVQPESAEAHDGGGFSFYYGPSYGGFWPGYGSYYGFGGHDAVPHWHDTYTPFGGYRWYGTGSHDYYPHAHRYTPFSYEGLSVSPWGVTRSYYPRYPYYYSPW